jgi:hypothetical protein
VASVHPLVTYSRTQAEHGRRIVNMLDGRVLTEHVGRVRKAAANA